MGGGGTLYLRSTMTTRLLSCILPASFYAKNDKSIDGLHECIAEDLARLFRDGLTVPAT